jgi:hypothetical protein
MPMTTPTMEQTTLTLAELAAQLGETEPDGLAHLKRVYRVLGPERTQEVLDRTLQIERDGGLMLPDGSRRRTPGGVFFTLVRESVGHQEFYRVFRPHGRGAGAQRGPAASTQGAQGEQTAPAEPPFTWEELPAIVDEVMREAGKVMTAKMTLIGTVGKVVERGELVFVAMVGEKTPTAFPKGVPAPTRGGKYLALIGRKQWGRVAEALKADPSDRVVVEGYPSLQEGFKGGISLHCTSATTVGIQAAKRAAQQAQQAQATAGQAEDGQGSPEA